MFAFLGGDPAHPSPLIELRAPISGTIVEQNVAGSEGIKSLDNTPNLFTIADLSRFGWCAMFTKTIWAKSHFGDTAEIRLNAFPDRDLQRQSRGYFPRSRSQHASAKVRIVLANRDGSLRPGMFAVATFRSRKSQPTHRCPVHRHHAPAR